MVRINRETYKSLVQITCFFKWPLLKKKNPTGKNTWQYSLTKILFCYCKGEESPVQWLHWTCMTRDASFSWQSWGHDACQSCNTASSCVFCSLVPQHDFFPGKCCLLTPGLTCPFPTLVLGLEEWGSWGCWHLLFSWENGRKHVPVPMAHCINSIAKLDEF